MGHDVSTGGVASLTSQQVVLSGNVSCPQNTWTDVLSLSLTAGTWILIGKLYGFSGSGTSDFEGRLHDGTNTLDSGSFSQANLGYDGTIPLLAVVTPASTTTYKIQANTTGAANATASAALAGHGVGNNSTRLVAVKVA